MGHFIFFAAFAEAHPVLCAYQRGPGPLRALPSSSTGHRRALPEDNATVFRVGKIQGASVKGAINEGSGEDN